MGEFSAFANWSQTPSPQADDGGGEFSAFSNWRNPAPPSAFDSALYNAADSATISLGDEIAGGIAGAGAVLGGGDYALAYRQRVDAARQRLEAARAAHPIASMAGSLAGAAPLMLIPGAGAANAARAAATGARMGLAARAAQGAGRVISGEALPFGRQLMNLSRGTGLPAISMQSVQGLRQGAVYGAVYGAGAANEGDRAAGAGQGALLGAALGGLTPPIFQGLAKGGANDRFAAALGNAAVRAGAGGAAGAGAGLYLGEDPIQYAQYGALGGIAGRPILSRTAGPVLAGLRRAWDNPRAAFGGGAGMSLGLPIGADDAVSAATASPNAVSSGGGRGLPPWRNDILERTAPPERPSPAVVREFANLAHEEGITNPAQLRERVGYAIANPMGRVWADIFGKPGTMAARAYAQGRGVGSALGEARLQERKSGLLRMMMGETPRRLGVKETPMRAGENIDDAYERIANERYNPILNNRRIEGEDRVALDNILEKRFDEDILRAAQNMMRSMARMRGDPTHASFRAKHQPRSADGRRFAPGASQAPDGETPRLASRSGDARYYHSLYSALGHTIRKLERSPEAIQGRLFGPEQLAAARKLRGEMARAMDKAIDGYGAARTEWAGLADARDMMDDGRRFIAGSLPEDGVSGGVVWRPEEFARHWNGLTDFQRNHFRIGAADELQRKFSFGVHSVGNTNFAKTFNVEAMQDLLAVVFDNPKQAQRYFQTLNEGNQLMGNAIAWGGGSSTAANLARAGRGMFARAVDEVDGSGILGAARKLATRPLRLMRDSIAQMEDDEVMTALMARMDDRSSDQRRFRRALFAELKSRLARQEANARNSIQGGIASGLSVGSADDGVY